MCFDLFSSNLDEEKKEEEEEKKERERKEVVRYTSRRDVLKKHVQHGKIFI